MILVFYRVKKGLEVVDQQEFQSVHVHVHIPYLMQTSLASLCPVPQSAMHAR